MAKRRADVSTAADIEVLAARFVLLEDALMALSKENDALQDALVALSEDNSRLHAAIAGLEAADIVIADAVDEDRETLEDFNGRVDELEATSVQLQPIVSRILFDRGAA